MDWQTPLRSQQAEFIKRLKTGMNNLLFCHVENCFSEYAIIADKQLKQLRDAAWSMTERQRTTDSVRHLFLESLANKLGEETVRLQLEDVIARDGQGALIRNQGKTKFSARQWKIFITYIRAFQYLEQYMPVNLFPSGYLRLAANPSTRLLVKSICGDSSPIAWSITSEEIEKNVAVACTWIQEEVTEFQSEYHVIFMGFLPTSVLQAAPEDVTIGPEDLLYSGGLRNFLECIAIASPSTASESIPEPNSAPGVPEAALHIGSWKQPLSLEQLIRLRQAIQELIDQHNQRLRKPEFDLAERSQANHDFLWRNVLNQIRPFSTQALLRKQSYLLAFDDETALIGISSEALFDMNATWLPKVKEAFRNVVGKEIQISLEVVSK